MTNSLNSLSGIYVPEIRISDNNANVFHSSTYVNVENDDAVTNIVENSNNKGKRIVKYIKEGYIYIKTENGIYNIDGRKINK